MKIFDKKIVIIFGGTGSFGKAFLQKLINSNCKEIRIFSRDEKKQGDLRDSTKDTRIKYYIGDVRDRDSVFNSLKNVDFAFHAAALKQVPSCEFYPMEAVKTNVLGTENIIIGCINNKVNKLVCLSTDKAVYPINAMGMSKALMEKTALAYANNLSNLNTKIMITRYGNVLFSRGSVLPLFIKQIKENKEITVTDLKMTRFLMSLDEAIHLVIYALTSGQNGNIYIPKTNAATIETLAHSILKIYKKPLYKIKTIGIRLGEKMHETLMSKEERLLAKNNNKYFSVSYRSANLNYDKYFLDGKKNLPEDYNSNNTKLLSINETIALLKPLIKSLDKLKI
jgi:UDP-N-acetylglucosamine 4,6-dehydratase/5-epimerase